MPLKDHYRTLGLSATASREEIRKAYRSLAHSYHPDKNQDNPYAKDQFHEILEAYQTLSDDKKKRVYDEERYFSGLSSRKDPVKLNGEWILSETRKLSAHMTKVDSGFMNHKALHDYILLLLSEAHLAILKQENKHETNRAVIEETLQASRHIESGFFPAIALRLSSLTGSDESLTQLIREAEKKNRERSSRDKYLPFLVAVITLLLCLLMYWYSRR